MRREGSPWTGLWAVALKELADHLSGIRMRILEVLMFLTAVGTVYVAIQNLRETVGEDPFVFLKLFTISQDPLPSFVGFLGFLIPLTAIALQFDAINGERSRRTLSRVLAQPIYRDALLLGKFLAGLATVGITLLALWLLVTGMGLLRLGVVPSGEEVGRGLLFLLATLLYAGVWLALALTFSVYFPQPATSALSGIAVWLFFAVFWGMLSGVLTQVLAGGGGDPLSQLTQIQTGLFLSRLSPNTLFAEAVTVLLNPSVPTLGPVFLTQLEGRLFGAPLPLGQSLLLIWPQLTGLAVVVVLLFVVAYVIFQRQEVRA